jgi:hypothetical protein
VSALAPGIPKSLHVAYRALPSDHQLSRGFNPSGNHSPNTMNARYYISTGAKSNYYTLRHSFEEHVADGIVTRDYHVRNLSIDKDEAINKSLALLEADLGYEISIDFDVLPIGTRREIDWSIIQGGKYAGQSIHEVRDLDTNYLVWLCENCATSAKYAKTVELTKALVASELAVRQDERDALEVEREARIAAFAPIADLFDREYPVHAQTGYHQYEYTGDARNSFVDTIINELRSGNLIGHGAAEILIEKVAKLHGRRNSKAYNKAYESILATVTPAIKP